MTLGPHGTLSEAHRPVVAGRRGMVCSGHPLASEAGLSILRRGGNAVDASLALVALRHWFLPEKSGQFLKVDTTFRSTTFAPCSIPRYVIE